MAVRVNSIVLDHNKKEAKVGLFADSQSDITTGMSVEGVPEGYTLAAGSSALTADKKFAFLKSNGTWNW